MSEPFRTVLVLFKTENTPSLPLLPDPLWVGVVVPDRVLSIGQINLCKQMTEVKLNC